MKNIPLILLAISGAVIDSFFMFIGMITEGYHISIAVIACLMITGLSAYLFKKRKFVFWSLVLVYSVLSTNSGQYQLLSEYRSNDNVEQYEIDNSKLDLIKEQIAMKKEQIAVIDKVKYPGWYFSEQKKLMGLQEDIIAIKSNQSAETVADAKKLDKFQFYSRGNATAEALIIFFFQIAFSIICSLCAPYAVNGIGTKPKTNKSDIIRIMFSGYLAGTSKKSQPLHQIQRNLRNKGVVFSASDYKKVLAKLFKKGIINNEGEVVNNFATQFDFEEAI